MSSDRIVWKNGEGDTRKKKKPKTVPASTVDEKSLSLHLRRLTSGKGRTVIEIKNLPSNMAWCQTLAKQLKKSIGVGGTFKNGAIELHGEKLDQIITFLTKRNIPWKKTGG